MQNIVPLACFFSLIRPPGIRFENGLLQIVPVNKAKCPFVRDHNDIGFQLFTRHNPTVHQELVLGDDEKLFASNIDFHDPTVIYFGAFLEQPDDGSGVMVREAYMLRGDTNVIMVDARHLEAGPWYFTAAENTWYIGNFVAQFIDYLVSRGLNLTKTHLVGHSLGAQSAGVAGSALKSGRVSRITGLDPAFPLFDKLPLEQRLDPSDAEFVDVIHTDAGIFGFNRPIGHVDFYPNGGISPQPGCELEVVLAQQHLTNKCDGSTTISGFYNIHLEPNGHRSFEKKLYEFLTHIQALKNKNKRDNIQVSHKNKFNVNNKLKNLKTLESAANNAEVNNVIVDTHINSNKYAKLDNNNNGTVNITDENINVQNNTETNHDGDYNGTIVFTVTHKDSINMEIYKDVDDETTLIENMKENISNNNIGKHKTGTTDNTNMTINSNIEINNTLDITTLKDTKTLKPMEGKKRHKRFIPFFRNSETTENNNFLIRMLELLMKHRKNVVPVITVMREINTLVKSGNGQLNHFTKERNNYIGTPAILPTPSTYTLELGNESKAVAFVKKLLGLAPKGDRLTINSGK